MLDLILRTEGTGRMVYSTSRAFRFVFASIALLILLSLLFFSGRALFDRSNTLALVLCAVCLLSSLFLERWVFDRDSNLFEKNAGLVFFYSTKKQPLDSLKRILLDEPSWGLGGNRRAGSLVSRRTAILFLEDRYGRVYKLDMVKGSAVEGLRKTAEKLSGFCGIPLETNRRDPDGPARVDDEGRGDPPV